MGGEKGEGRGGDKREGRGEERDRREDRGQGVRERGREKIDQCV